MKMIGQLGIEEEKVADAIKMVAGETASSVNVA